MTNIRCIQVSSLAIIAAVYCSPAAAQESAAPSPAQVGGITPDRPTVADEAIPPEIPEIIVTGSLIAGSREDSAVPVDVISSNELAMQGAPSAIDLVKNLPTSSGVVGDVNPFDSRSQGNEGVASVNLRGLGPQRTLVLLNGRRIAQFASNGLPLVDVNLIPSGAIGRVEILKDGAAATYGSDALAGVINFITRKDQEGFLVSGDFRAIQGSKGDYGGAASYGLQGSGYRVLASLGYQHRSELRTTDRDFAIQPYAANPQGGYTGGGNPGNFGFSGTPNFVRDLGCTALGGFQSLPGSTTDRCFNNYNQFGNLVEPENRWQAYLETEISVADGAELTLSGLYGHTDARLTTSPTYLPTLPPSSNAANGGAGLFVIPTYAPALRDYCAYYGAASGCSVDATGAPNAPAIAFPLLFRPALLGGNPVYLGDNDRGSARTDRKSESIRLTAEMNVDVTDRVDFVSAFTFSQYTRDYRGNDTFGDLLQNAISGFGGSNCAYATPSSRAGLSASQLALLAGTNGCTFFNPFSTAVAQNSVTGQVNPGYAGNRPTGGLSTAPGAGLVNDVATFDHFLRDQRTVVKTKLFVGDMVLSGRLGFSLPGGAIGFALGGQYRKEIATRKYGDDNNLSVNPCPGSPLNPAATCTPQTGALGFLGSNINDSSSGDIYALFAELQLPIFDALNAQLSARYEDYGSNVGSTFDPQVRVKYQLADWLALRGGVGTTFRGPPAQQLSGNVTALQAIGTSFRAIDINGNPRLKPEDATTYNIGLIVEAGGFRASVDYFRYDISGMIEAEPIGGMVSALFGASGTANCDNPAYAALQSRFTFTAAGCGIGNILRLRTQYVNLADVSTSGLDVQASWTHDIGSGSIMAGVAGSYVINYKVGDIAVEGVGVQPAFDAAGLLNFQTTAYPLPRLKGSLYLQGDYETHSLRLQLNHISGYTDQRGAAIFGPNTAALAGASVTRGKNIKAFRTLDATYRFTLKSTGTTLSISALNIFDRDPPFARLDQNYDTFTASPLGFTAKLGVSQSF